MGHLLVVNILLKCDDFQLLMTQLNWWFYTKGFQKLFKTLKKGAPLKVLTSIPLEMYTANVYRDLQVVYREIRVQGFQIYGDCPFTQNPCNFEIPTLSFPL